MTFATGLFGLGAALCLLAQAAPQEAAPTVATAATAAASVRAAPLVLGESLSIDSKVLNETRRINVWLPPDYRTEPSRKWPVLYMPDGGLDEDFMHVAGLVQILGSNGQMRPFMLVGIENTERRRDLTGPSSNEEDKKVAPRIGGSAQFRRFLREELFPAIEHRYRTTPERAIIGESVAGLFVIETLTLAPEMFDSYFALDPSLWWNDAKLLPTLADKLAKLPRLDKNLYFVSSDAKGMAQDTQKLADVLRKAATPGLNWQYVPMPQETHASIFHPAALNGLRSMLKPVAAKQP
jgi:predicted alpha/beta superfamily hydrolase